MWYEYESVKESSRKYKCTFFDTNYSNLIDEKLKKKFMNTFKVRNNDINKFILLLRKSVYPYEYMGEWEKFNVTPLPEKEEFFSNLVNSDINLLDLISLGRLFQIRDTLKWTEIEP